MKRKLLTAACAALVVAMAVPALADHQIGGYFRTQGIMDNIGNFANDMDPTKVVDNRLRMRWQNNLNEYVQVVWFGEVDTVWGKQSKGNIGGGGQVGADGVNVETKHAFAAFKIPETPVSATVGIQGYGGTYDGVLVNDDMAGAKIDLKTDMVDASGIWSKWDEGDNVAEDDCDFWGLNVDVKPIKGLKLGADGFWKNDNSGTGADNYYAGIRGAYDFGIAAVDGWFMYNFGTVKGAGAAKDTDIGAFAAAVKGSFKMAGVNAALRLLFFSNDDDKNDDLSFNGGQGAYEFPDAGLMIFLTDAFYNNTAGGRRALTDAAYAGYGLFGTVLNGSYTPPMMKNLYVKAAVAYFMAMDDKRNDEAVASKEGTQLGAEFAAQVGIKVAEKVDVSLRGAYALLGDFYDAAPGGKDPDDIYKVALMVNVPY